MAKTFFPAQLTIGNSRATTLAYINSFLVKVPIIAQLTEFLFISSRHGQSAPHSYILFSCFLRGSHAKRIGISRFLILAPHFNHMLESKLKDIRKYIWVEEICHGWAVIDWDTFSKISKNRTILDIFSEKPTTKWRNSSLFWQLHIKKLFWAGLVSKQKSFHTTNFCFCYVMEVKFENLDPLLSNL